MRCWFVIHDYSALKIEPTKVGKKVHLKGKIDKISKGDKVLYYATGDMVIAGAYDVISNGFEYTSEHQLEPWDGTNWAYTIKRRNNRMKHPVPIKEIVSNIRLKCFPGGKFRPILFKGRTTYEITKADFQAIERFMKGYMPAESKLFQGPPNEGNLGEPIDLDILNYAPTSEQGVVVLFASFMKQLPYGFVKMEFVRSGFPDACVIQRGGHQFARKYIEFEFRASSFKEHIRKDQHKNIKCDYVVCWKNDFHTCPIPVIELKSEIVKLNHTKNKESA
jgi:hypothetical protein